MGGYNTGDGGGDGQFWTWGGTGAQGGKWPCWPLMGGGGAPPPIPPPYWVTLVRRFCLENCYME